MMPVQMVATDYSTKVQADLGVHCSLIHTRERGGSCAQVDLETQMFGAFEESRDTRRGFAIGNVTDLDHVDCFRDLETK